MENYYGTTVHQINVTSFVGTHYIVKKSHTHQDSHLLLSQLVQQLITVWLNETVMLRMGCFVIPYIMGLRTKSGSQPNYYSLRSKNTLFIVLRKKAVERTLFVQYCSRWGSLNSRKKNAAHAKRTNLNCSYFFFGTHNFILSQYLQHTHWHMYTVVWHWYSLRHAT